MKHEQKEDEDARNQHERTSLAFKSITSMATATPPVVLRRGWLRYIVLASRQERLAGRCNVVKLARWKWLEEVRSMPRLGLPRAT